MGKNVPDYARPRVIRGTRAKPLPLLPSGPGGVYSRPLHEARSLTSLMLAKAMTRKSVLAELTLEHLFAHVVDGAVQLLLLIHDNRFPALEEVGRRVFQLLALLQEVVS